MALRIYNLSHKISFLYRHIITTSNNKKYDVEQTSFRVIDKHWLCWNGMFPVLHVGKAIACCKASFDITMYSALHDTLALCMYECTHKNTQETCSPKHNNINKILLHALLCNFRVVL